MPLAKVGPDAMRRASASASCSKRVGGDELVEKAPALAFLRRHGAAGVEKFGGAALADDARQHRAGAHVAAGKPDAVEQERGLRLRRGDAQIGRHGDDRAGADRHAVDRGNDRLAAMEHRLDQIAGHARERQQLLHVHGDQRADDLVHIAAGAEIAAVGQEHDGVDIVGVGQGAEGVAQLGIGLEGQRILALRAGSAG